MNIDIELNRKELDRAQLFLLGVKNGAGKAMARAINKTLSGVKTDASTEIRSVITAKKKDVDRTFKIEKASKMKLKECLKVPGSLFP